MSVVVLGINLAPTVTFQSPNSPNEEGLRFGKGLSHILNISGGFLNICSLLKHFGTTVTSLVAVVGVKA